MSRPAGTASHNTPRGIMDWTPERDAKLMDMRSRDFAWPFIARALACLPIVAQSRLRYLTRKGNTAKRRAPNWLPEEDAELVSLAGTMTNRELARKYSRSESAIKVRLSFLRGGERNWEKRRQRHEGLASPAPAVKILAPWPEHARFDVNKRNLNIRPSSHPIIYTGLPFADRSYCGNAAALCAEQRGADMRRP